MTTAERTKFRKQRQWVELKQLGYTGNTLAKINSIERRAHKLAEDTCNIPMSEATLDKRLLKITEQVREAFGGELPDNFFINLDSRGYALKINQEGTGVPITYQDMGGYGILAPEDL